MVNCINLIIEMSPRFVLGRENVPCVAEVVNRSLKADCTDFTPEFVPKHDGLFGPILLLVDLAMSIIRKREQTET